MHATEMPFCLDENMAHANNRPIMVQGHLWLYMAIPKHTTKNATVTLFLAVYGTYKTQNVIFSVCLWTAQG